MSGSDGGPAFPQHGFPMSDGSTDWPSHPALVGMSLRDYFAGQALVMLSGSSTLAAMFTEAKSKSMDPAAFMAKAAYEFADAMLAERAKAEER